jgi:hypothetical protein
MHNWLKQRQELLIMLLLFLFLSSVYYATTSGLTSSNDGSHYALVRAMADERQFSLSPFDSFAEGNDIAVRDGVFYSDRPPGTALVATLFYGLGWLLPAPLAPLPSRHDAANPRLPYVLLLPVLAGAATAVLLYWFMRQLHLSAAAALLASLMFGLGTLHWKYSTVLFSHALSGLLVIAVVVTVTLFAVQPQRPDRLASTTCTKPVRSLPYVGLGFLLGLAVLVEYSNGLLVGLVGLFLLGSDLVAGRYSPRRFLTLFGGLALGGLLPALFLGYYNQTNFGSPFTLSYAYAINYPWAGEFGTTFSFPLWPGLQAMLWWGEGAGWCDDPCFNQGLFLLSPLLLLALPGLYGYGRSAPRAAFFTTAVFLIYLLLFARHHTFHGFTGDGRYLVPFIGLLIPSLGFTLDWLLRQKERLWLSLGLLLIYGLFFLSLRNILLHIGHSYNYNLQLDQLDSLVAHPQNWAYIGSEIFPNMANLPLLWLVIGCGAAVGWVSQRLFGTQYSAPPSHL